MRQFELNGEGINAYTLYLSLKCIERYLNRSVMRGLAYIIEDTKRVYENSDMNASLRMS